MRNDAIPVGAEVRSDPLDCLILRPWLHIHLTTKVLPTQGKPSTFTSFFRDASGKRPFRCRSHI